MKKYIFWLSLLIVISGSSEAKAQVGLTPRVNPPKAIEVVREKVTTAVENRVNQPTDVGEKVEEKVKAIYEKREAFRERLTTIKDERKQKITERVDVRLANINDKSVASMSGILKRMSDLLDKLAIRVTTMGEAGKDMTQTQVDIAKASEAIVTAKEAVAAQADKDYVIEFVDETALQTGASEARAALKNDLSRLRNLVNQTREAVTSALQLAKEA